MGYIFDALNNAGDPPQRKGDSPVDPQEPRAENTKNTGDTPAPTPTLRLDEILAKHTQQAAGETNAPNNTISSAMDADLADPPAGQPDHAAQFAEVIGTAEPKIDGPEETPTEPIGIAIEASPTLDTDTRPAALNDDTDTDDTPTSFRLPGAGHTVAQRKWYQFWKRTETYPVDDRLVVLTDAASSMAEEYRSTRTSLLARHQNERHLVHTITSATPQEGKSITCLNLGLALAELRNRKTVVVECDLRLPTFDKLLQLDRPTTGLIPYLHGDIALNDAITKVPGTGLDIISAGGRVSDEAVQMLSSGRMSRLIQSLRAKYDHVIIDTPPVIDLADAGILGAQGDEVLLVARMRRTPQELVEQAIRTLNSYNAQVAGVIATDNPRTRGRGYGYRYGYSYRYTYAGKRRGRRRYAA